jgi:hypothetical protein
MRRFALFCLSFLLLGMVTTAAAPSASTAAADLYKVCGTSGKNVGKSPVCKSRSNKSNPVTGSNGLINEAINIMAIIGGIIAVLFIIVGGIKYITSGGDGQKAAGAKNTLLYAVVGLVVIALARTIIYFVLSSV